MEYLVIDVREPAEYQSGHVKNSVNIPLSQLTQGTPLLKNVQKDTHIITYCRTGSRSHVAVQILNSLGYTHVTNGINKEQVEANLNL